LHRTAAKRYQKPILRRGTRTPSSRAWGPAQVSPREHVAALPGLAVCGAAYDGVGIPACIASAHAAVDALGGDRGGLDALSANPVQSLHGGAGE
ncbi:hypothetical protein ABZS63_34705, partial [Streptomyces sp. NPDC005568]